MILAYQRLDNISDRHREMINGLKNLKNLSLPQILFKEMIIKLFQVKILNAVQLIISDKLGQGNILDSALQARAAKTQAIENLFNTQ